MDTSKAIFKVNTKTEISFGAFSEKLPGALKKIHFSGKYCAMATTSSKFKYCQYLSFEFTLINVGF
jgi:hypothetical protein